MRAGAHQAVAERASPKGQAVPGMKCPAAASDVMPVPGRPRGFHLALPPVDGELEQRAAVAVRIGNPPFGVPHADPTPLKLLAFGLESGVRQRPLHVCGGLVHHAEPVGVQVHIGGEPVDDTVHVERTAAGECEPVFFRRLQGDRSQPPLQLAECHYAAFPSLRRTACFASQACRTRSL
jgi:hypothetical protein